MQSKCGLTFNEHKMFVVPAFIKMGVISAPFGAYFGLLVDAVHFGGTRERVNKGSFWLAFLRFLTISAIVLPITIPFFYISSSQNHVWVLYLFKVSAPFFLATFVMFAFGRPIFERLAIQREIDNTKVSMRGGGAYEKVG